MINVLITNVMKNAATEYVNKKYPEGTSKEKHNGKGEHLTDNRNYIGTLGEAMVCTYLGSDYGLGK